MTDANLSASDRELLTSLARAALLTKYQRPSKERLKEYEDAMAPVFSAWRPRRTLDLETQAAKHAAERDKDRAASARQLREREQQLRDAEVRVAQTTEALRAQVEEARQVGRDLWQLLPPEAKLALFESGAGWVPDWVRPNRD